MGTLRSAILHSMKRLEKFPWPIEEGAVADFVDDTLILAVKDDEWNDAQLGRAGETFTVGVCETNGIVIFLMEGGPLDTCDFYFNIQDCDEKEKLLEQKQLKVQAVLIDEQDVIRIIKSATLSSEKTAQILDLLKKQNDFEFMPGEYDCNVEGLQSAYEPSELAKYEKTSFDLH